MSTCFSSRPVDAAHRTWAIRVFAGVTTVLPLFVSQPASALPSGTITCTLTTYYSTAKKVTKVGQSGHCPGAATTHSGKTTPFFTTKTVRVTLPGGGSGKPVTCNIIDGQLFCTSNPANH